MSSYQNFQSDNAKFSKNRDDARNPAFHSAVDAMGDDKRSSFEKNLDKYAEFVSWSR